MEGQRIKIPLTIVIITIIVILIVIFCISGPHSSPVWNPKTLAGNKMEDFKFLTQSSNKRVSKFYDQL